MRAFLGILIETFVHVQNFRTSHLPSLPVCKDMTWRETFSSHGDFGGLNGVARNGTLHIGGSPNSYFGLNGARVLTESRRKTLLVANESLLEVRHVPT